VARRLVDCGHDLPLCDGAPGPFRQMSSSASPGRVVAVALMCLRRASGQACAAVASTLTLAQATPKPATFAPASGSGGDTKNPSTIGKRCECKAARHAREATARNARDE